MHYYVTHSTHALTYSLSINKQFMHINKPLFKFFFFDSSIIFFLCAIRALLYHSPHKLLCFTFNIILFLEIVIMFSLCITIKCIYIIQSDILLHMFGRMERNDVLIEVNALHVLCLKDI